MTKEIAFQNIPELKKQFQKNLCKFYKVKQQPIPIHLLKLNNDLYLYDKKENIILSFQLELKSIHEILNKKIRQICQIKWEALYGEDINWEEVWSKLKQVHVSNKIKEFQWID